MTNGMLALGSVWLLYVVMMLGVSRVCQDRWWTPFSQFMVLWLTVLTATMAILAWIYGM